MTPVELLEEQALLADWELFDRSTAFPKSSRYPSKLQPYKRMVSDYERWLAEEYAAITTY